MLHIYIYIPPFNNFMRKSIFPNLQIGKLTTYGLKPADRETDNIRVKQLLTCTFLARWYQYLNPGRFTIQTNYFTTLTSSCACI